MVISIIVFAVLIGIGIIMLLSCLPYFHGMRFKEVSWRWTAINLFLTWHGGRNPVSGHKFLYVGIGPFFGLDFYWPAERVTSIDYARHQR